MNIKTELPDRRKDYRNTSVVVYEYEFDASDTMMSTTSSSSLSEKGYSEENSKQDQDGVAGKGKTKTFKANWEDFKPTYRGRPVPSNEAKELNPAEIKEISIMCRSNVRTIPLLTLQVNQLTIFHAYLLCSSDSKKGTSTFSFQI